MKKTKKRHLGEFKSAKDLLEAYQTRGELLDSYRASNIQFQTENDKLKTQIRARLDTSMIDARNTALDSLSKLGYAVAEAMKYVVGKEVM